MGLHCPDLTAGTPVYTPDELGADEPDADIAAAANELPGDSLREDRAATDHDPVAALRDAAADVACTEPTLAARCRFFCATPDARRLTVAQAREMAERLCLAATAA